jgi:UTP-glucose-1-phosphate uridylyltransferase
MREVTIILPCAGEGRRLGLPFPKELAPLGPDKVIIDSCLTLISEANMPCRIILMDNGNREVTRDHIRRKLPDVPLAMVRQHRYSSDLPDAVIRLEPWFGDVNILMLPDVIYQAKSELVGQFAALASETGFAFAAARLPDEALRLLGALSVTQDSTVKAFEDKPSHPEMFNAAWGMIGFSGPVGLAGLRVVASSTAKLQPARPPAVGAPVLWLDGFQDCGTWEGYLTQVGPGVLIHRSAN